MLGLTSALVFFSPTLAEPPVGPVAPAGVNASLVRLGLAIQEALATDDPGEARRLARALPVQDFGYRIDWSELPEERRPMVQAAWDSAVAAWRRYLLRLTPRATDAPGLLISFTDRLPAPEDDTMPRAAAHLFAEDPLEPRLEVVLAARRGSNAEWTSQDEFHNEFLYALGAYYGLAPTHLRGTAMARSDASGLARVSPAGFEGTMARRMLDYADELRALADAGKPVTVARPRLYFEPGSLDLGRAVQGQDVAFSLQVTNLGNAPLRIGFLPDCSCLQARQIEELAPGESGVSVVRVDTINFVGHLIKKISLLSNDPDFPDRIFDFEMRVDPISRFVGPSANAVTAEETGRTSFDVFLALSPEARIQVRNVQITGIGGDGHLEPYRGTVTDPNTGEEFAMEGYRIRVTLPAEIPFGRLGGGVVVETDHPMFSRLEYGFTAQRGIVALPESLFLGERPRSPMRAWVLISRPHRPFRILGVDVDNSYFRATATPVREAWEYRVDVEFDGRAPFGNLTGTLTVRTDDPRQPVLQVPIRAVIR